MESLIDTNLLRLLDQSQTTATVSSPPHAMMETPNHYSIFLNLLGIDRKNIAVALNEGKRELTVLAKRERAQIHTGFFWLFNLPEEGSLSRIRMHYKNGAVEIRIPKMAA